MASVALFHPVLGIGEGTADAAARLRAAGHDVLVADLFEGCTFDDYAPAMEFVEQELGHEALLQRAVATVADLPDGFVTMGFSLGCLPAVFLAAQRPLTGVVMVAGAIPITAFGSPWPDRLAAQTHATLDDPWREQDEIDQTRVAIEAGGGALDVFDYPGTGHLFTDPSLRNEYDAASTELLWSRVLAFVAGR
jgi:dienelactone hydrolase